MFSIKKYRVLFFCILPFLLISFSFSVCTPDMSNVDFVVYSNGVNYTNELGRDVAHFNLSSHPMEIILAKEETETGCFNQTSFGMLIASTVTYATDFSENTLPSGQIQYLWSFDLSQYNTILTGSSQLFEFCNINIPSQTKNLLVSTDSTIPNININRIQVNSQVFSLNQLQQGNLLKTGDLVYIEVLAQDDSALNILRSSQVLGATVVDEVLTQETDDSFILLQQYNLTNSPLNITYEALDIFSQRQTETMGFVFDSQTPSMNGFEITSYQIEGDNHVFYANLTLLDDFEIDQNDIDIYLINQITSSRLDLIIENCESNYQNTSNTYQTNCRIRSSPFQEESSFDTTIYLRFSDRVGNEVTQEFNRNIFIDSTAPEVIDFRLTNSNNQINIISKHTNNFSQITLSFRSEVPELYQSASFQNGNSGVNTQVVPDFGPLENAVGNCFKNTSTQINYCTWNVSPALASTLGESFNISVVLIDVVGNFNQVEIEIEVDNQIPEVVSLSIKERGNERNELFESLEMVRIEVFVNDVKPFEELFLTSNGSQIIFKESSEDLFFNCEYDTELDQQICYSNDFQLNYGFDGDQFETLFLDVKDRAGNIDSDSIDVKIYKINENESIDYFSLKNDSANLLSPINRRIIKNEGIDVYHFFELEEKDTLNRFEIVSIQLLGSPPSSNDTDIRLRYFELKNETSQGVVLGDNRDFYLKSFMPQLLSVYETEERTRSEVYISIIKKDIDTIYKLENLSILLPIDFYDMPRGLDSNVALAEKLLDDINGIDESRRNGEGLLDIYMAYYNLCNTIQSVTRVINTVSTAWSPISQVIGKIAPGITAAPDTATGVAQETTTGFLGDTENIINKVCMLASCEWSQELLGNAINGLSGDLEIGSYLTGEKTLLGTAVCRER